MSVAGVRSGARILAAIGGSGLLGSIMLGAAVAAPARTAGVAPAWRPSR
jgi:hypothetical protein